MVGLSIVLDLESSLRNNNNCISANFNKNMISKATMTKPFSHSPSPCKLNFPAAGFLDRCFLCGRKLLPGKDIYMYKGDRAFCSMECRSNQILMDEEETSYNSTSGSKRDNCSFAATKGPSADSQSSSSSSSYGHNHKGGRSRNGGKGFVF